MLSERSLGATHAVTLGCAEGLAVLLAEQVGVCAGRGRANAGQGSTALSPVRTVNVVPLHRVKALVVLLAEQVWDLGKGTERAANRFGVWFSKA